MATWLKIVLALIVLGAVGAVQAAQPAPQYDPFARAICHWNPKEKDRHDCLETIKGHRFDKYATRVCSDITPWKDQKMCLKTIKNHRFFSLEQLQACEKKRSARARISCLRGAYQLEMASR